MTLLEKIDNYFYEKSSKKEFYYVLVLLALVIGFVVFYYFFPYAKKFNKDALDRYKKISGKLEREKNQLRVLKIQKIRYEKSLQILSKKLNELKKEKVFFNELINLMDFAEFNKAKWANFLKNLIIDAKSEGLKVKLVNNKIYEEKDKKVLGNFPKNTLVKKMSVGLELKGNYLNFIHFIYKYENMKELIRVEKVTIKNNHEFFVEFSLYGYAK